MRGGRKKGRCHFLQLQAEAGGLQPPTLSLSLFLSPESFRCLSPASRSPRPGAPVPMPFPLLPIDVPTIRPPTRKTETEGAVARPGATPDGAHAV